MSDTKTDLSSNTAIAEEKKDYSDQVDESPAGQDKNESLNTEETPAHENTYAEITDKSSLSNKEIDNPSVEMPTQQKLTSEDSQENDTKTQNGDAAQVNELMQHNDNATSSVSADEIEHSEGEKKSSSQKLLFETDETHDTEARSSVPDDILNDWEPRTQESLQLIADEIASEFRKSDRPSVALETKFSDIVEVSVTTMERKLQYAEVDWDDDEKYALNAEDSQDKKLRFEQAKKDARRLSSKGMRFEYGRCPKTCERFLNIEDYSKIFVDEITEDALSKGKGFRQQSAVKIIEGFEYAESEESLSITSIGTYVCVLEWPTIEQFNVEVGTCKINEYLSYWKFEEDWKYCINFLLGESDAACDFYRYEAIFSIPCKFYPVPQATASVYFTFEVSRIRPKHCLVDVYYWFEGQRLVHVPGKFTFQEERLFNIVDAKIAFYKTITF